MTSLARVPRLVLVAVVRSYQLVISPWTAPTCKYYPSCSSYAVTALERHGALSGSWLAVRRLGRCHPWSDGGIDDVPPVVRSSGDHPDDRPDRAAQRSSGHPHARSGQH